MRVLFFLESLYGGGKERRSVELIRYLKEQPEEYDIELVLTEEEIYYEDIHKAGIKIRILKRKGMKYDPGIFIRFYRICRSFKPDLIHAWGKMATFYAIPAKIACGVPLVSSLIADSFKSYSNFSRYYFLLRTNLLFSDIILANSQAGLKAYNIRTSKARVIYNGVRLSRFRLISDPQRVREEFGIRTRFIVIMVAAFSHFKDYDLFIDIAKEAKGIRDDVTFLAVGDGIDFNRISKRVDEERLSNVVLSGRQKHVEKLVAVSDIGLLCTKSEGISNSIIEYMAMGKPVIATDVIGGSRELMIDGVTGYCTERNKDLIIELINRLLDNEGLRFSMGMLGKERIESKFSVGHMGEEFQLLYRDVIDEKKYRGSQLLEKPAKQ